MATMQIHCPGCHGALRVPVEAVGRYGRCPVCKTKFVIPKPAELFEEAVTNWLEEDIEREEQEEDQAAATGKPTAGGEKVSRDESPRTAEPPPPTESRPSRPASVRATRAASQIVSGDTVMGQAIDGQAAPPTSPAPPPPGDKAAAPTRPAAPTEKATAEPAEDSEAGQDEMPPAVIPASTAPVHSASMYPTSLHVTEPIPRLVVNQVTQYGVVLSFDSIWLEHDGFRASLPMACPFCGKNDRKDLMVRPMIFAEHSLTPSKNALQLEAEYRQPVKEHQPTHFLSIMGRLANMSKPFDSSVLYYTCGKHSGGVLDCTSRLRPDGGWTCTIKFEHGPTALQWLARVNGVCGREHMLLEQDLAAMSSDAWSQISENTRQRLAVWCKFGPGEQFRHYISDAEMSKHDAGLAGIVITSHRLIFHKYHSHGEISLNEEASLIVRRSGITASISVENASGRYKLGKLGAKDVATLIDAMSHAPKIKLTVTTAEGGGEG